MTTDTTPALDVETPVDLQQVNAALAQRCEALEIQLAAALRALESRIDREAVVRHVGPDSHRVPIQRQDHDVLVDIADLLTRQTATLEHIRAALGQTSEDRTSVKIETGAKRELKPTVHVYAGDTDQAANTWLVEEAIRLHQLTQAYCTENSGS